MRNKSIIVAVLALASLIGVTVSGCNRDQRTAMKTRPQPAQRRAEPTRRPAEVLSASAYRPSRPEGTAAIVVPMSEAPMVMAQTVHVQPVAYAQPAPVQTDAAYEPYTAYAPAPTPAPAYVYEQPRVYHTPELAVARASLPDSAPPPAVYQPAPQYRSPPIPELEPVRYRVPVDRPTSRPVAEVIMSASPDQLEMQRALAPLGPPPVYVEPAPVADTAQGWVPSPVTAMRY